MTDPCTPWLNGTGSDFTPRITTDWVLSLKYDSNQEHSDSKFLVESIEQGGVIQSVERSTHI